MTTRRPVKYNLSDCRAAHDRIYDVQVHDGESWVPHGPLAVMRDAVTHDGDHIHTVDYHGANHALLMRGKAGDPTFQARLNLTECGTAFVGTISTGGGAPQAVRGSALEQVYTTQRRLSTDLYAPFVPWKDFTIRSGWVGNNLKITYLLGTDDVSDRVRATRVDRQKGETTLEMVPQTETLPFRYNTFDIVLASGARSFGGTLTDDDGTDYLWRGGIAPAVADHRAAVFRAAQASRPVPPAMAAAVAATAGASQPAPVGESTPVAATAEASQPAPLAVAAPGTATMSLQDLDNISSIQVLTDKNGSNVTVDYAQTTCGDYFNKCLVNALDQQWIDGIYGHPYILPAGVQQVFTRSSQLFKDNAVLGTGQMLYDNLGTSPTYKDLIQRIDNPAMYRAWQAMGKSPTVGVAYQEASSALYIQGYRDAVTEMQPYLQNNPEQWAEDYFNWLCDSANLLTWQIQVASREFTNVTMRMYEWYVKLQVLAPDKDYGKRFLSVAYAALLGVNYSKARWSDDLKPFLRSIIQQAIDGKADTTLMDEAQQQAAEEQQGALRSLIQKANDLDNLVDAIATVYRVRTIQIQKRLGTQGTAPTMEQLAGDPEVPGAIGDRLLHPQEGVQNEAQYEAWNQLTRKGQVMGVLAAVGFGASAGFLIYSIIYNAEEPLTPLQVVEEVNVGIFSLAIGVKTFQKLMSIGVGKALETFAAEGAGKFRSFAGGLATWFKKGGKIVPEGPKGRAFVRVFGASSAEFMARRIAPALALFGLALSAYTLYNAFTTGTLLREKIFDGLNTFFALADTVSLGIELFTMASAGPIGLALAVIGILASLVQFIWDQIDPPPPPPDPINEFVNGPMVNGGFAHAA